MNINLSSQESLRGSSNPYDDNFDITVFEEYLKKNYCFCEDGALKCIEEELVEKNIKISTKHAHIEHRRYTHEKKV